MTDIQKAFDAVMKEIANDCEYRNTWQANIAMAIYDEYNRCIMKEHKHIDFHKVCNDGASNFLDLLCHKHKQKNED